MNSTKTVVGRASVFAAFLRLSNSAVQFHYSCVPFAVGHTTHKNEGQRESRIRNEHRWAAYFVINSGVLHDLSVNINDCCWKHRENDFLSSDLLWLLDTESQREISSQDTRTQSCAESFLLLLCPVRRDLEHRRHHSPLVASAFFRLWSRRGRENLQTKKTRTSQSVSLSHAHLLVASKRTVLTESSSLPTTTVDP